MKKETTLYTVFAYGFGAFMVLLAGISLLTHDNPFLELGRVQLLAATILVGSILFLLLRLWDRKGKAPQKEWLVIGILFLIYFAAQCFVMDKLQVLPRGDWDYTLVFQEAEARVLHGTPPTDYFGNFPNNVPFYWLLVGFFGILHFFGVTTFMQPLVLLNMLCIDVSLLMMYGIAKRILGKKWACMVLILGMISPALLLYVPIAYTDTLTLPFVCGAAYLWLLARECFQKEKVRKMALYAGLAGVVTALGAVLKVSVAILFIAFVLDALLFWGGRHRWMPLAVGVACFAVVLLGGNQLAQAAMPEYDLVKIPYTHWIMMGLHGDGSYYDPDYKLTLSYPTYEERVAFHKQEIGRRLQEMGPLGFLDHCREKLAFMISDGTYFAPSKLNRAAAKPSIWHEFVVPGGKYAGILYYCADALQICLLLSCAVGSWRAARGGNHRLTVYRVAWFGLVLFLLLWENRSRYLVNFIPLFLLCAGSGFCPQIKQNQPMEKEAAAV